MSAAENVARLAFVRTTWVWLLLLLTFVLVLLLTVKVWFIFCWVACFEVAVAVAKLLFISALAVVMGVVVARRWFLVPLKGGNSCQQGSLDGKENGLRRMKRRGSKERGTEKQKKVRNRH